MKKPVIFFASLLILLIALGVPIFGQEKYTPKPNEELYGTWVNDKMNEKMVMNPDGSFADYYPASYNKPYQGGKSEIFKKWTDSEGNVFYNTYVTIIFGSPGYKTQDLCKVSKSGTVLEMQWVGVSDFGPEKFPSAFDAKTQSEIMGYFIYYRAKE